MSDALGIGRTLVVACMVATGCVSELAAEPEGGMLRATWTHDAGPPEPVPFSYHETDENHGQMSTTLGRGGEHFTGTYVKIEHSTHGKLVAVVYQGWAGPAWSLWDHGVDGAWNQEAWSYDEFAHFYTGKVLATLVGDRGSRMRCQLELDDPSRVLLENGRGQCQLTDGSSLELEF